MHAVPVPAQALPGAGLVHDPMLLQVPCVLQLPPTPAAEQAAVLAQGILWSLMQNLHVGEDETQRRSGSFEQLPAQSLATRQLFEPEGPGTRLQMPPNVHAASLKHETPGFPPNMQWPLVHPPTQSVPWLHAPPGVLPPTHAPGKPESRPPSGALAPGCVP